MCALDVMALVFDVFGTVVDWRTSIIRQGKEFGRANGVDADWEAFADAWRGKYGPSMNRVRTGELPWTNLDALHRMALEEVLSEFNITGLSEDVKAEFNLAWHRPGPMARLGARPLASQAPAHHCAHVKRQHRLDDQHGQKRRAALGLHPGRGSGQALQAGP